MPSYGAATMSEPSSRQERRQGERHAASYAREKKQRMKRRWAAMLLERQSWESQWKDIERFLLPRNGRFFRSDRNRGDRRHEEIYDGTGFLAMETAVAGLVSTTVPSTESWFELRNVDEHLNDVTENQEWFEAAGKILHDILRESNFYATAPRVLEEFLGFGTACSFMADDYQDVIRIHHITCGEFAITQDNDRRVTAMYREFDMTAEAMVDEFGEENCSEQVQRWAKDSPDQWVTVLHAVEKRKGYDSSSRANNQKPYSSCYIEMNGSEDKLLSESGFDTFRVTAPRFKATGGDIYGNGPGMAALPFVMASQLMYLASSTVANKLADPPMKKSASMKNREVEQHAGGETWDDGETGTEPLYVPHPESLKALRDERIDHREQIKAALHADKFLMLQQAQGGARKTQLEVAELRNEKFTVLGPFAETVIAEWLGPTIDALLERAFQAGALPPPPPSMGGSYNIKFTSRLAQLARQQSYVSTAQFVGELAAVANIAPEVKDRFDADGWVDEAREALGASVKLVRSKEDAEPIRKANAAMRAKQAQMSAENLQADTAQKLAKAQLETPSALSSIGATPSPTGGG